MKILIRILLLLTVISSFYPMVNATQELDTVTRGISAAKDPRIIKKDPRSCPPCPTTGPCAVEFENLFIPSVASVGSLCVSDNAQISGNVTTCGIEHIVNTTDSTGCSSGALIVDGGASIGKTLRVCGTGSSTGCSSGALVVSGGAGIGENINVCGDASIDGSVTINNTGASTGCGNGALVVAGGASIGQNLNICGTGASTDCSSGALTGG